MSTTEVPLSVLPMTGPIRDRRDHTVYQDYLNPYCMIRLPVLVARKASGRFGLTASLGSKHRFARCSQLLCPPYR